MGRHIYTFHNICEEDKNLKLKDGAVKVFLNSKGTIDDVEPDIKAFLQYVEGILTENPFAQEIAAEVAHVKSNNEWRREFMTLEMELKMRELKGREEGIEEGIEKGRLATALEMLKNKLDINLIAKCTYLSIEDIQELARKNKLI